MTESISIPRSGEKALEFHGRLLDRFAGASPDACDLGSKAADDLRRRVEVYLYETDGESYVVWVVIRSEPGGALERSAAYAGKNSEELICQLRSPGCVNPVINVPPRPDQDQALIQRELRAHWENVVQLIEWSIDEREKSHHAISR
jgi:hypothetical protein